MPFILPARRASNLLLAAVCAVLLGYAYYQQYVVGLQPCPLCIFQRVAFLVLMLVLVGAALHPTRSWGAKVWALLIAAAAGGGAVVAGRHVWLQSLPADQVPACGPGLDYLIDVLPASEVLAEVFAGSGECAKVDWTFLGLAMPVWTLIAFTGLGAFGIWNNWRRRGAH